MTPKQYAIIISLVISHGLVWQVHTWMDDSVKLAIEETRNISALSAAKAISKIDIKNTTITKTIHEKTKIEVQYKECKHSPETYEEIKRLFQ